MALGGDATALRLCLERIVPPRKDVTPTEGAHIMGLVETYRRTLETTELEARLAALEAVRT